MGYSHKNSKGVTYWLHSREGRGGAKLFFFSKNSEDSIDLLNEQYEVFENPRTGLPMIRKRK
jgi:hypothetical protein